MTPADRTKLPSPLYAVVGGADLLVRRLRTTAATVEADQDRMHAVQSVAQQRLDALLAELRTLPDRAQTAALDAIDQATTVYDDLARRGETLVTRIRNQQATQDTVAQARTTVAQAKGTATTARKQAAAGAADTRTGARRTANTAASASAARASKATKATRTRAKATRTSATKTARSATKAASKAAEKVGD